MHVRDPQLSRVQDTQPLGMRNIARCDPHPMTGTYQAAHQLRTNEAAASKHTDIHP
jgi:hypothetical protein